MSPCKSESNESFCNIGFQYVLLQKIVKFVLIYIWIHVHLSSAPLLSLKLQSDCFQEKNQWRLLKDEICFSILWKINLCKTITKYKKKTSLFLSLYISEGINSYSWLRQIELNIVEQTFLVHIACGVKCIWNRWSPDLTTKFVSA